MPLGAYVSVCGSDIVRTADGFMVLEDNLRVPSGVSYMLACREAIRRSFPRVFRHYHVRSVDHYGQELRRVLRSLSPRQAEEPSIALLTPGVYNSAYYEHAFLAREMGIELVTGDDLLVRGTQLYMRTVQGLHPVDVLYRRLDDDFIDPRPSARIPAWAFRGCLRSSGPETWRWPTRPARELRTIRRCMRMCRA